jgi:hypothetical protein
MFSVKLQELTCEIRQMPLDVDNRNPRFGWKLTPEYNGDIQAFYQIEVRSDGQSVWNTGKVRSDRSQLVSYNGKPLQKGQKYSWTVKVWNTKGHLSDELSSFFHTAPELPSSGAKWIGAITRKDARLPVGRRDFHNPSFKNAEFKEIYDNINPLALRSIMLRKSFDNSKEIERAIVYVSGLGHYNLSINGKKVSDDIFTPVWSDYDQTVYYNTYYVDSLMNKGENIIGATLGNGFYNTVGNRYRKLWVTFGPPTLFFEMHLHYKDGSSEILTSDTSWKYAESPVIFNDIFGGEDYDARLEQTNWNRPGFNDSGWKPVVLQEAPAGTLRPQQITSVRKMKEYGIVSAERIGAGYVFDMGQNLSGYPAVKVKGKKGQTIKITVGEQLDPETGAVSQKQSGGPHTYSYTLKGDGIETWHPGFSYYGFQYIQIDSADILVSESNKPVLVDLKSHFIYNSTSARGHFECSNELFNKTHEIIKNAVRSNMQSVFTDCPHREKLGWLEETHLNGPGLLYNWDMTQFFPKIMQDMKDRQQPGGFIPTIVPEYVVFDESLDVFRDSPEWGIASAMLPWLYYKFYGDNSLIKNYFDVMKNYVDHMTSRSTGYIISHGLGDWYDYGEHRAGFSKNSPVELSATAHYYYGAHLVAEAAKMLHKTDDEKKYRTLATNIKKAFNNKFFDTQTKQYGTGSQFCNAVALFMGIVSPQDKPAVMENLKADIHKHGDRLTTGDVGNRYLFMALALNEENELMYRMHNHTDAPGYGFQVQYGVTTLTEQWDPRKGASWNHFMMGQIDEWFFRNLAGIEPGRQGFKEFTIQPQPVGDLEWVKTEHETIYGNICVYWKRKNGKFHLSLEIPGNTKANVILPDGSKKKAVSGKYEFECKSIN